MERSGQAGAMGNGKVRVEAEDQDRGLVSHEIYSTNVRFCQVPAEAYRLVLKDGSSDG